MRSNRRQGGEEVGVGGKGGGDEEGWRKKKKNIFTEICICWFVGTCIDRLRFCTRPRSTMILAECGGYSRGWRKKKKRRRRRRRKEDRGGGRWNKLPSSLSSSSPWGGGGRGCFPISWIEFNRVLSSHIRRSGIPTVLLLSLLLHLLLLLQLLLLSFHLPSVISWHFNSGPRGWISKWIELHYIHLYIYIYIFIYINIDITMFCGGSFLFQRKKKGR